GSANSSSSFRLACRGSAYEWARVINDNQASHVYVTTPLPLRVDVYSLTLKILITSHFSWVVNISFTFHELLIS
ncbi:unnamed protein product, partial [Hymenolepis diminuta]